MSGGTCLVCAVPIPKGRRCRKHEAKYQAQRRAAGLTGARGSTRAGRKRRDRILARAHRRCFYCGHRATIADHFFPLSAGGPDIEENLVAACEPCNQRKGEQMPGEFMASAWLTERKRDGSGDVAHLRGATQRQRARRAPADGARLR